ncbi:MAG: hypothetical protein JSS53_03745 [Proteobacteria bacterium]|nr:hypothetical protein [Pseudomonadota bacterium]
MPFSLHDTAKVKPRIAGLFLMPLRWTCAWILFAAAWRRLVLKPEALDPSSPLYEGLKLNHFIPHTAWIKPILNYVVLNPDVLLTFLWCFTIMEATTGILLFLGLGTRFLGLLSAGLFTGLMLVAGWLGTTCLDEWTVASFGIGIGLCLFLAGSGPYSIDALIFKRFSHLVEHRIWGIFVSPELSFIRDYKEAKRYAIVLSILALVFVLYTNQHFVGGVYGPFHNPATSMNIKSHTKLQSNGDMALTLYRNEGPDTYGAFIIHITLKNSAGNIVLNYGEKELGQLSANHIVIHNRYPVKALSNGYAFVLPLGCLVTLHLTPPTPIQLAAGEYHVIITDVSGRTWESTTTVGNSLEQPFNPYNLIT